MDQKKNVTQNAPLDYEQVAQLSRAQVEQQIIAIGGDVHQSESKTDLMGRLLQLQGTAQPIDNIRKKLQELGVDEDGKKITHTIPKINKRLTREEMTKVAEKYIAMGMRLLINKDCTIWEIRFECEQAKAGGGKVIAKRKDSGNTMMPIGVFKNACEHITTFTKLKTKDENDDIPADYEEIDGEEAA